MQFKNQEDCTKILSGLLKECGIELNNGNKQLKAVAFNFPMEVYFLRDDDIPQYVYDGVADIGIVGENVVLEKEKDIDTGLSPWALVNAG